MDGLATAADIGTRLGRSLTDDEETTADLLIDSAEAIIARIGGVAVGDLDGETMTVQRAICIEMVARVLLNPEGFRTASETLGAYSRSGTYGGGGGLLELSAAERRALRGAFGLGTFQSVIVESPYSGTALDALPELPL